MKRKIIITTPIMHMPGIYDILKEKAEPGSVRLAVHIEPKKLRSILLTEEYDTIFCNPNQQGYILDESILAGTKVKCINTCSTGTDHIDMNYCHEAGIEVLSLAKDYELINQLYGTAELAFGLLMDLLRKISCASSYVVNTFDWQYQPFIGTQLNGMHVGVVGFGRLGKMMCKYLHAFGANVHIYDTNIDVYNDPMVEELGLIIEPSLEDIFFECKAISLHIHLTSSNKHIIDYKLLCNGNVEFIINTSRGAIVNEKDILAAYRDGILKGYAADVLESELIDIMNSPILQYKCKTPQANLIITPHVGGMTHEGQLLAYTYAANKL